MSTTQPNLPVLRGQRVVLRPVAAGDVDRLTEILAEPGITPWWGRYDTEKARDEFLGGETAAFAIEVIDPAGAGGSSVPRRPGAGPAGEVVGCIEYHEENEPDYRHAGMDIFVATDHQGRGLGTDALRTLARHLFDERGHHRLTIDPAAANDRAIRTYRRIGFRPVGIMRRYERDSDGVWRDGLLMDLLSGELC
jgi:aminoglycoside 6'-N-acetyltransferase